MSMPREKELHCPLCTRAPLLATYGVSEKGVLFVHVKIWKQNRVFGEIVVEGGSVKLKCRECLRWHVVVLRQRSAVLRETSPVSLVNAN